MQRHWIPAVLIGCLLQACGEQDDAPRTGFASGAAPAAEVDDDSTQGEGDAKPRPKKPKSEADTPASDDDAVTPAEPAAPPADDTIVTTSDDDAEPTPSDAEPTPTPSEPDPRYSRGSGGGTGLVEQSFQASNGLTSTYKIMVPADAGTDKPYGLHVHVHGDGGGGYRDFPNTETRDGLIGVTVKAPNANLQWGRAQGATHGVYLQELIQNELVKKYNVDLKRIYFSGVSGGAYFLAGNFIPSFGSVYRSGAFLMCGGEAPRVAFNEPAFLKEFQVYWQVTAGERADILASVRLAMAAYRTALDTAGGVAALQASEIVGPGGHCEFDDVAYTSGIQFMMDKKFAVVVRKD